MEDEAIRALEVIARIAMNEDPDEKDKAWGKVYMLAHSFSKSCTGHSDWCENLAMLEQETKNF